MKISRTLLRGAAVLAVGATLIGSTVAVPVAAASGASASVELRRVDNDNSGDDGGIGDVPIIGDLVGSFEGQEPEDIAVGAIQLTAGAAETVVPMVFDLFK